VERNYCRALSLGNGKFLRETLSVSFQDLKKMSTLLAIGLGALQSLHINMALPPLIQRLEHPSKKQDRIKGSLYPWRLYSYIQICINIQFCIQVSVLFNWTWNLCLQLNLWNFVFLDTLLAVIQNWMSCNIWQVMILGGTDTTSKKEGLTSAWCNLYKLAGEVSSDTRSLVLIFEASLWRGLSEGDVCLSLMKLRSIRLHLILRKFGGKKS